MGASSCDNLKLRGDRPKIIERVFSVDEQPVKPGADADFGNLRVRPTQPASQLLIAPCQGVFERIVRRGHKPSFKRRRYQRFRIGQNPNGFACPEGILPAG